MYASTLASSFMILLAGVENSPPLVFKEDPAPMPLKTGIYTITSELFSNLPLGLDPAEIGSGPKVRRVLALPNFDNDVPAIRWKIVRKDAKDTYEISIDGGLATNFEGQLFAVSKAESDKEWKIELQKVHGSDIYTITTRRSSFSEGWHLATDDEFTQLSVRPLVMVPSYPPRFIHNEIFKIVPVHHHD
ncbi:hypothetical protein FA13DRAFT_1814915 [Coprinellus micaceus]|uniref:Ricin B lectin domain-containing protein n=1 Tax=Coprinellus micaceus TaxID=71717 RepID=A0A4Y7T6P2_COPMI|nr:hypothetical protein FA13DRAFT_1814915 [Coprinellus micaceus]